MHSAYRAGSYSGHVRVFTSSYTANKWNRLSNTTLGASSSDLFGSFVSILVDEKINAVNACGNDDNGHNRISWDYAHFFCC